MMINASVDLESKSRNAKALGQDVVAVIGLGFVGTAVVANLARTLVKGKPRFFVIGIDQNNPSGQSKCQRLNDGLAPVYANDTNLEEVFTRSHKEWKNILGTVDPQILKHVDTVVVCINLDLKRKAGQTKQLEMNTDGYAEAMRTVGEYIRPGTLVTVESTLPVGLCDKVLYPALCEGQRSQGIDVEKQPPLLAYCYERVMPGPDYLDSVNNFWRAFAGINQESSVRAREFLSIFVNTKDYPLWEHKTTRAAELSKLLENSYRATNIAFIEEWSRIAEDAGIDLFDVIASVRLRKGTHDNMMWPGLGVGGYCLTKDALLAAYGAEHILKIDAALPFSRNAILTNELMPLRAFNWIKEHFRGALKGKKAALLGVTYRPGVADTRSSATEIIARALVSDGVSVTAYDPLITLWEDFPEVEVSSEPENAIRGADIIVVCLPDKNYKSFLPQLLSSCLTKGSIIVDPWNMVGDETIQSLTQKGIVVKIYGRGDIPTVNL